MVNEGKDVSGMRCNSADTGLLRNYFLRWVETLFDEFLSGSVVSFINNPTYKELRFKREAVDRG